MLRGQKCYLSFLTNNNKLIHSLQIILITTFLFMEHIMYTNQKCYLSYLPVNNIVRFKRDDMKFYIEIILALIGLIFGILFFIYGYAHTGLSEGGRELIKMFSAHMLLCTLFSFIIIFTSIFALILIVLTKRKSNKTLNSDTLTRAG